MKVKRMEAEVEPKLRRRHLLVGDVFETEYDNDVRVYLGHFTKDGVQAHWALGLGTTTGGAWISWDSSDRPVTRLDAELVVRTVG